MDWGFDLPDHFDGLDAAEHVDSLQDHLVGHLDLNHDGIPEMSHGVIDLNHDGIVEWHGGIVDLNHDGIPEMNHGVLDVNHDGIPESHNGVVDIDHDGIPEGFLAVHHVDPFLQHDLNGSAPHDVGLGSISLPNPFNWAPGTCSLSRRRRDLPSQGHRQRAIARRASRNMRGLPAS